MEYPYENEKIYEEAGQENTNSYAPIQQTSIEQKDIQGTSTGKIVGYIFLSYVLPLIGGIISYFSVKKEDKDLARFSLWNSILHPIILSFLFAFIIIRWKGIMWSTFHIGEIYLIVLLVDILFVSILTLISKNKYRHFIATYWFAIVGSIYTYLVYKESKKNIASASWIFGLIIFFVAPILVIIGVGLAGIGSMVWLSSIQHQTAQNLYNNVNNVNPNLMR